MDAALRHIRGSSFWHVSQEGQGLIPDDLQPFSYRSRVDIRTVGLAAVLIVVSDAIAAPLTYFSVRPICPREVPIPKQSDKAIDPKYAKNESTPPIAGRKEPGP